MNPNNKKHPKLGLRRTGLVLGAALALSACSDAPTAAPEAAFQATGEALNGTWRPWALQKNNPNGFTGSPAVCSAEASDDSGATVGGGWAVLGRDKSTNRFRISLYQFFTSKTAWSDLGNRTFNSKPACANLDDPHSAASSEWSNHIVVAGKSGGQNKYFIRVMKLDNNPELIVPPPTNSNDIVYPPDPPTVVVNWTALDNSAFASAPALAVNNGALFLVGRRSDNLIYAYRGELDNDSTPYNHSNWSSPLALNALPSGWTAKGDPAISGASNYWGYSWIATRAEHTSGVKTVFYTLFNGYSITGWSQVAMVGNGVSSDPSLEVDHYGMTTMYIRDASDVIYQASSDGTPWTAIPGTNVSETPAGFGNTPLEGTHLVFSKHKDDQIYYAGLQP